MVPAKTKPVGDLICQIVSFMLEEDKQSFQYCEKHGLTHEKHALNEKWTLMLHVVEGLLMGYTRDHICHGSPEFTRMTDILEVEIFMYLENEIGTTFHIFEDGVIDKDECFNEFMKTWGELIIQSVGDETLRVCACASEWYNAIFKLGAMNTDGMFYADQQLHCNGIEVTQFYDVVVTLEAFCGYYLNSKTNELFAMPFVEQHGVVVEIEPKLFRNHKDVLSYFRQEVAFGMCMSARQGGAVKMLPPHLIRLTALWL